LSYSDIRETEIPKSINGIDNVILNVFMFEELQENKLGVFCFITFIADVALVKSILEINLNQ
jgi:hypothetical protein